MLARCTELYPAHVRAGVVDSYRQVIHLGAFAEPLEPFDCGDALGEQILAEAQVVEADLVEPVEIDMIEREASVMLLDHREGRAQDIFFAEPQAHREAFDKDSL